jgi:hypothetical protein
MQLLQFPAKSPCRRREIFSKAAALDGQPLTLECAQQNARYLREEAILRSQRPVRGAEPLSFVIQIYSTGMQMQTKPISWVPAKTEPFALQMKCLNERRLPLPRRT